MMQLLLISANKNDSIDFENLIKNSSPKIGVQNIHPNQNGDIIQLLSEDKYDLVFIALEREHTDNQAYLKQLVERFSNIPFVLICNEDEKSEAIQAVELGLQDYVIRKRTTSDELLKIISTSIARENLRNELEKAQSRAEEALAYKDRMLARMSHQIRTPLNAITGMSELLQDTELSGKQSYYNQLIRESSNKLVGLINDLLDFSKIEAGLIKIHEHPFNLHESVHECIQTVLPDAINRKIDLSYHLASDCPQTILGDDLRIRQLILNLLENAIKFTQQGHVLLKLRYCNEKKSQLCISVEDTGKGIEKELIPTLFKPYTKLDVNNAKDSGVGLGLAICKNLVEMMNGSIHVDSEVGKGSVFTIELPIQTSDDDLSNRMEEVRQIPEGLKVLYFTSDSLENELLEDYFSSWGLQLEIRFTTEESPVFGDWLNDYDVLITNLRDNKKLDLKLVDRVRAQKKMPHILFKNPDKANDRLTVIRKDTVILLKPINIWELQSTISLTLQGQGNQLNTAQNIPTADEHLGEYHPLEILVAEDNAINQKIIQGILNRHSYQPKMVENGRLVLDSMRQRTYDIILMDIQMPEMDGMEATRRIRQELPKHKQPLIIALTADALQKSRKEYMDAGMDDVLYKPVQTRKLMELLARSKRIDRS
jgi:signal transduction histidine kinase/ActR/RegA family two-component response regulator